MLLAALALAILALVVIDRGSNPDMPARDPESIE